jgi:antitoxin MazE
MKLQIVRIGNSLGIRIPKALLEQCGFKDTVTVKVEDHNLILSADKNPREGWKAAFKKMAERGDDQLLDSDQIDSAFDKEEWEW